MALLAHLKGPINKPSLAESVYQHVLEAILTGSLPGGTELSAVALAAELGVSRTPVQEALLRLAADGLVEHLPNRCDRVARFTRNDIREIYEMRIILECAAVERAARRLDPEALVTLRSEADALTRPPHGRGWIARALDFDVRFHDTLASAAGNERLQADVTRYRHLVRAFCRMSASLDNLREAVEEHRRILSALEAQDGVVARRAMAAHIEARLRAVLAALDDPGIATDSKESKR